MRRFVEGTDRGQSTLFPECLEDWICEDNPVRAIDVFIDELDLAELEFGGVDPQATGRPSYHPSVLLKLYIYSYLNRVQSSRRLEREAGRNVEAMWLTGRLAPDHKTIADFRKDNGSAIRKVCAQFVALCREMGLLVDCDFDEANNPNWGWFVPGGNSTPEPTPPPPLPVSHDIKWLQLRNRLERVDQQLDRKPSASSWTGGTDGVACAHGSATPSNRKSASDYRRPHPHSQVMDNGIPTSSLAVDLLWETRVYRGCLRWLRFASVEKRPPHRLKPASLRQG